MTAFAPPFHSSMWSTSSALRGHRESKRQRRNIAALQYLRVADR
jgi:hypothetical protein